MLKYLSELAKSNPTITIEMKIDRSKSCAVMISDHDSECYGRGLGDNFETAAKNAARNYLTELNDSVKEVETTMAKRQAAFNKANGVLGKIMVMDNDD